MRLRVGRVEYFSDAPDKPEHPESPAAEALTQHIAELLHGAEREVMFETPYLVLSSRAQTIFHDLHKRTPRVPVIVSTNSLAATDAFYVYALSHKYKKRYLKRYGFEIHEFKPFPGDAGEFVRDYDRLAGGLDTAAYQRYGSAPLKRGGVRLGLHAKSLVIDGAIALIGSHNFDPRSDDYNTESGFIIHDTTVALRVRSAVLRDAEPENAWVIAKRHGAIRSSTASTMRSPTSRPRCRCSTSGRSATRRASSSSQAAWPCRPSDPHFYDCYDDVGDFPEVDLPMKTIYTRIVTAFGAGLAGIL